MSDLNDSSLPAEYGAMMRLRESFLTTVRQFASYEVGGRGHA